MRDFNAQELFDFVTTYKVYCTVAKRDDGKTFEGHIGEMPLKSIARLLQYGFQRHVNDPIGGDDKSRETKLEMASELINDLYNGFTGKRRAEGTDPTERFAIAALKEATPPAQWKEINKRDDAANIIATLLLKYEAEIAPRAAELKKIDDDKKAGAAKVMLSIDLKTLELKK